MIVEFSVAPVTEASMSKYVARCLEIVEASGMDHQLTAMGTLLEGDWDRVMGVIRQCHHEVLKDVPRVLTTIRIDDRKGVSDALSTKVASVERLRRGGLKE